MSVIVWVYKWVCEWLCGPVSGCLSGCVSLGVWGKRVGGSVDSGGGRLSKRESGLGDGHV